MLGSLEGLQKRVEGHKDDSLVQLYLQRRARTETNAQIILKSWRAAAMEFVAGRNDFYQYVQDSLAAYALIMDHMSQDMVTTRSTSKEYDQACNTALQDNVAKISPLLYMAQDAALIMSGRFSSKIHAGPDLSLKPKERANCEKIMLAHRSSSAPQHTSLADETSKLADNMVRLAGAFNVYEGGDSFEYVREQVRRRTDALRREHLLPQPTN